MSIGRRLRARGFALALACTAPVVACSASLPPATVHTAEAPNAPFGRYRTFTFDGPQGAPDGYTVTSHSLEVQQKMRPLVVAALQEKGYVEVPEGGDFIVMHGAGRRSATGTRRLSPRAVALMGETEQEREFLEGSLVVNVYDRITGEEVWHGAATAEISGGSIDQSRLAQTVRAMMAAFPAAHHFARP